MKITKVGWSGGGEVLWWWAIEMRRECEILLERELRSRCCVPLELSSYVCDCVCVCVSTLIGMQIREDAGKEDA